MKDTIFRLRVAVARFTGLHDNCSPIKCKIGARLCNEAESQFRTELLLGKPLRPRSTPRPKVVR